MRNLLLYMQQALNGFGADPGDQMEWIKITDETWEFTHWIHQTCDAVVLAGRHTRNSWVSGQRPPRTSRTSTLPSMPRWFRDV